MHDGRFESLREVIDHYNEGVVNHPNLDFKLKTGNQPRKLNLTEEQKLALETYLRTLTDETLIADVRFADPFK